LTASDYETLNAIGRVFGEKRGPLDALSCAIDVKFIGRHRKDWLVMLVLEIVNTGLVRYELREASFNYAVLSRTMISSTRATITVGSGFRTSWKRGLGSPAWRSAHSSSRTREAKASTSPSFRGTPASFKSPAKPSYLKQNAQTRSTGLVGVLVLGALAALVARPAMPASRQHHSAAAASCGAAVGRFLAPPASSEQVRDESQSPTPRFDLACKSLRTEGA